VDDAAAPTPPRKRSRLRRVLVVVGALLVVMGALTLFMVYRPLSTRGAGVVAGGTAASFTLHDQTGKPVALADLVAHGPAVLVFYRGYW
jgi:cytochrome oxidase Cu insertion factor (SCO1/SenC/PrrC family)